MNDIDKIYEELGEGICLFPFIGGFYSTVDGKARGDNRVIPNSVRPCGVWQTNKDNSWTEVQEGATIAETRNSDGYRRIREMFLAGKWKDISGCNACHIAEQYSNSSTRTVNNAYFAENINEDIIALIKEIQANNFTSNNIKQLGYFPSNYCDYECVMCFGGASSKRNTFEIKHKSINTTVVLNNVDSDFYDVLTSVDIIGFTGGETIMQKQVHELIDYLIEKDLAKNISINILTNASKYPENLIDKFKEFKKVAYTISIDGIGDIIEYQRRGAKWDTVQDVARKIHNTPHLHDFVNYVLTSMNVLSAMEWIDWMHDNDFKWFAVSPVHRADHLSLLAMPEEMKTTALTRLQNGRKRYQHYTPDRDEYSYVRGIDQIMQSIEQAMFDPAQLTKFVEFIKIEDSVSKKPLHEVVPEWAPYF
jgi:MoaA/NifB/PqqE/SkfB family radical SAM enzyme